MDPTRTFLTVREAADYLRLTAGTVYRLAQRGSIPAFKVGGQWRFDQGHLDAWIVGQLGTGTCQTRSRHPRPVTPPATGEPESPKCFVDRREARLEMGLEMGLEVGGPGEEHDEEAHRRGEGLVLVIDDDEAVVDLVVESLSAVGYRTEGVPTGRRALESIEREVPSLVLLDTRLPEMGGLELARFVRTDSRAARVPVVFLTGLWEEEATLNAILRAGDGYLVKPCRPDEIEACAARHLGPRRREPLLRGRP